MTPEHAEIMRLAAEALDRSGAFIGAPIESGPATIAGCPAYVEVDHEAGVAHIRIVPLVYEQDIDIGFEPCPT